MVLEGVFVPVPVEKRYRLPKVVSIRRIAEKFGISKSAIPFLLLCGGSLSAPAILRV